MRALRRLAQRICGLACRSGLLAVAFAGSGGAETAAPIHYKYCAGVVLRLQPVPDKPGHYAISRQRGRDWVPYGKAEFDTERRLISQEVDGLGVLRYVPHNCEKSAGICSYTETGFDGETVEKIRINGRTGDEWNYSVLDVKGEQQDLATVGTVRYGADGFADKEEWTQVNSTQTGCFERISAPAP